mmetsp:Transcript_6146/g.17441  ORF Transcript_6146/g.17441 Transcript_6146/m.17441 type:complete len:1045 (+) Transcript_6146:158-3292(+)|eukprot:CAMPEP_0172363814 /NCGR_PEP_ID=MMETSP1060-20121228/7066_1 /TAXON_ID=37318 /ORGANISM="Pseudo-nitzschia pungens, Strain cf. cingulata" /LENGTH=1044 /DNA_ID=CAMNT_0013086645 /DNA_START=138 /DNA_END=3272 /DNA_ORIENTATION=+
MGQSSRRRKGKGGSRSSTPTPTEKDSKNETHHAKNASTKGSSDAKTSKSGSSNTNNNTQNNNNQNNNNNASASEVLDNNALLVLTSEKRRGIYECDYCHSDISQQPRIRCAVCTDFDLCLDCFTTSDHGAMMARIKAANQTRNELHKDGIESSSISISSAAAHHEDHHCYRVCDSTRYPIFPPGRIVVPRGVGGTGTTTTNTTTTSNTTTSTTTSNTTTSNTTTSNTTSTAQSTDIAPSAATRKESSTDEPMVDRDATKTTTTKAPPSIPSPAPAPAPPRCVEVSVTDEAKTIWTVEEDLRLIDAIGTHGLGNWVDISDAISGNGSVGKTAKRCMERYLDDFLGRYGHILPQWTVVDDNYEYKYRHCGVEESEKNAKQKIGDVVANKNNSKNKSNKNKNSNNSNNDSSDATRTTAEGAGALSVARGKTDQDPKKTPETGREPFRSEPAGALPNTNTNTNTSFAPKIIAEDEDRVRTSKRRSASNTLSSSSSSFSSSSTSSSSRKKLRVVPTESLPGYDKLWSDPYLPSVPGAVVGKEVARDQSCKAELAFVKATLSAPTKAEADRIRRTWIDTKLGRVGAPTVLPPRSQDAVHLLGSELAGFMPRRGDFDVEWENDAETALADMEFIKGDRPEDKELKLKVLQIYCEKLDEREKRKKFVLNRHLYDYRTYVQNDLKLPVDERDLVHRMRLFERFHTPDEHKQFIGDILKAKKLRKEIAKLQMYRRIGIRTLAEAELYELDKDRRQFHKKLELDAKAKAATAAAVLAGTKAKGGAGATASAVAPSLKARTLSSTTSLSVSQFKPTDSLWKQYRTNDRKKRRSTSRSGTSMEGTMGSGSTNINSNINSDINSNINNNKSSSDNAKTGGKDGKNSTGETKEEERRRRQDEQTRDTNDHKDGKGVPTTAVESRAGGETLGTDTPTPVASKDRDDPMEVDVPAKKKKKPFHLSTAPCLDLLSRKERALCEKLQIYPVQYLEIKKALIHESLVNGLLIKESSHSSKRTIVKIDVERRGNIVEFLVRAGWINRKLGDAALRVVTPQPLSQN